jgi:integrase
VPSTGNGKVASIEQTITRTQEAIAESRVADEKHGFYRSDDGALVIHMPAPKRQPPRRRPNKQVRVREYLTEDECRTLISTAKKRGGRYGLRDALAIRMCWRHGLRISELVGLRWDHVEWKTGRLTVHRAKGSIDSTHPLSGDELRELRALHRTQEPGCRFIFMNERKAPMTAAGFRKMLSTVGAACGLPHVHPHMLRHSCGFYMADRREDVRVMQDWLGHANVQNTVRYTTLAPSRLDKAKAPG